MGFDRNVRIEPRNHGLRAVDLARADIVGAEDDLPLQVRQRHDVIVDNAQRADAGGGKIEQHRRTETAGADHQHARRLQLRLSGAADLAQHDVARITFQFLGLKHNGQP